jgi:3-oxoacyl-[acyl-carrier-protein] synthase-3/clorobiocin biosynthesis protein CloN2
MATAIANGWYDAKAAEETQLTGVAVAGEIPAPDMALWAAQDALKRCGQSAADLDLLLYLATWHQGPDGWLPHSYLQQHLGAGEVPAVEVRQGCNGLFSALDLAAAYLHGAPDRRTALIVAADNFGTPLLNRWRVGHGFIPGDAGSALLVTRKPGFARLLSLHATTVPEAEEVHRAGEPMFPPTVTLGRELNYGERSDRFRDRAQRDGSGTAALLKVHGQTLAVVQRALSEAGVAIDDIARVLFLNFSRAMVEERCMGALGLPLSKSTWEFGRSVGHLGASDHIVALDHLLGHDEVRPGDALLLVGVGPGIHLAAAVVRILEPPPWY